MSRVLALLIADPALLVLLLLTLATLYVVLPGVWRGVPTAEAAPSFWSYAVHAWIAPTVLAGLPILCVYVAEHPPAERAYARLAAGAVAFLALALLLASRSWSRRSRRPPTRSGAI